MLGTQDPQTVFFRQPLAELVRQDKPLLQLGREIRWADFETEFGPLYAATGRPAKPIRLMVGLLIIKQIYDLSDERVVEMWEDTPVWQQFCGLLYFENSPPCAASDLVHFRNRIGPSGAKLLFKESVRLHGPAVTAREVTVDTTCQEKNVTYPTDEKLASKAMEECRKIAGKEGVVLRQSYVRKQRELRDKIRFSHRKPAEKSRSLKKLKTMAGRLRRDVERKLKPEALEKHKVVLENCRRAVEQDRKSKNKIYSLHEPQTACIAKGKARGKFEFGAKAGIASCTESGVIVGAASFPDNRYDGDTLPQLIASVKHNTGKTPEAAICDRGFTGRENSCPGTGVLTPQPPAATMKKPRREREKARKRFQKRAGIEGVISQLKSSRGLGRNFLKGVAGDEFNLYASSAAHNICKWLEGLGKKLLLLFASLLFRPGWLARQKPGLALAAGF